MTDAIVPSPPLSALSQRKERRAALAPVLAAVPRKSVRRVHAHGFSIAGVVQAHLPRIESLRTDIARSLPDFDLGHIDNLAIYAREVVDAHTDTLLCLRADPKLPVLAKRGFELRANFIVCLRALVKHGLVPSALLKKLNRPSGYINLVKDLLLLLHAFQNDWARLENKTPLTEQDLAEAAALVHDLMPRVGNHRRTPQALREARDRRARAFTLLVETYNEVRAAVRYLRRKQGDADAYAPPLTRRKHKTKRKVAASGDTPSPSGTGPG